ncbi:unnamed protein product [Paramecium primaurelia]|uniref:Uncharacterized protein n=2 Tax=Paramecium TaxID=5884 RepID=A0A8S1UF46_9CILI|nr:unnamed protein product [Paramecium primaurelia]CAD8162757.1 unnamed protein product [Paramecium pentaurelia]
MFTQPSGAKSSAQSTPYKTKYHHPEQEETISEDESQINNILKALKQQYLILDNTLNEKEEEKAQILEDLQILNQRLQQLNKSIAIKRQKYEKCDRTLKEAESAFATIADSTKSLLQIVKSNIGDISKKQKN